MTTLVTSVDWSFADHPQPPSPNLHGLVRNVLVAGLEGAVHTELTVTVIHPGGWLKPHFHSFEESLYILEGELLMQLDGKVHRLRKGDFTLQPVGVWHALGNAGSEAVRMLSVNTPQRLGPDAGRKDTFFAKGALDATALVARAVRPRFGHPTVRYVGHYDGTPPQLEALAVTDPARGRKPIGMDIALLVYSGISVKMLVDRVFGADLLTVFTVDYEIGGAA